MLSPIKSLGDDALHAMLFASSPDILTRSVHEGSAARDASPVGGAGRFVSEYGTLSSNHRGERILTPPRAPASGVASSPGLRGFGGSPSDRLDRWMHSEREAQALEAARAERARFGSLMLSARRAQALEDTAASAALRRLRLAWEAWLSSGAPAPRPPADWQRTLQNGGHWPLERAGALERAARSATDAAATADYREALLREELGVAEGMRDVDAAAAAREAARAAQDGRTREDATTRVALRLGRVGPCVQ